MNTSRSLRILTTMSVVLSCALLNGCGLGKAKKDAETVVARHFAAIATNGYAEAAADYGPEAFQKTTREQWIEMQPKIADKLGSYVSHTTRLGKVNIKGGTSGSRSTVVLTCQVTYSKQSAIEAFTLLKGRTDRDFKIITHKITFKGSLEE